MAKPCRIELNNSGAWKLLGKFDASADEAASAIMDAAEQLARALNDPACGRPSLVTLRISTDDAQPDVLMRWSDEHGWRDARTGEPA